MNRKKLTSVIAVILAVLMLMALIFTVIPTKAFAVTQADIDAVQQSGKRAYAKQAASQGKDRRAERAAGQRYRTEEALDERNTYATEQLSLSVTRSGCIRQ